MSAFKFKQFNIIQEKSAHKVGTDGVLLGSWVSCKKSNKVLDVGCGSALITLMLAQRNLECNITGIEIDQQSSIEAILNVKNSNWKDRISVLNTSLQQFRTQEKFDLIVSNPPFFARNKSQERRDIARHANRLSFEELIVDSANLLLEEGVFAVVVPKSEEEAFCKIAKEYKLFCNRSCYIRGNKSSPIKRVLMEFSFVKFSGTKEYLIIEKSRHEYTDAYIQLCKVFYLNM